MPIFCYLRQPARSVSLGDDTTVLKSLVWRLSETQTSFRSVPSMVFFARHSIEAPRSGTSLFLPRLTCNLTRERQAYFVGNPKVTLSHNVAYFEKHVIKS